MARRANPRYMESWLNVQKSGAGQYQKFYCLARSRELDLFESDKETRNTNLDQAAKDKIPLSNVTSVNKEDKPGAGVFPTISILFNSSTLKEVRIRALNRQQQEQWYRVLYSLCMLELPPNIADMLPGLRMELEDMIQTEKQKLQQQRDYTPCSPVSPNVFNKSWCPYPPKVKPQTLTQPSIQTLKKKNPNSLKQSSWFFNEAISREESEKILSLNSEFGNLLLRKRDPAPGNCSLGISMKLENSQFKHYLVKEEIINGRTQFMIQLAKQKHRPLYTLQDIVNYMEGEFLGNVKALTEIRELPPGLPNNVYDTVIPRTPINRLPPASKRSASESNFSFQQSSDDPTYVNDNKPEYLNIPNNSRSATLPPGVPPKFLY